MTVKYVVLSIYQLNKLRKGMCRESMKRDIINKCECDCKMGCPKMSTFLQVCKTYTFSDPLLLQEVHINILKGKMQ